MSFPQSKITNKFLRQLLSDATKNLLNVDQDDKLDIAQIWTMVVGEKIAALSEVKSFYQGVLVIKVSSASLNHLLSSTEKPKIMKKLKSEFGFLKVKSLVFKTG